jgi:hypothetical protein
LKIKGPKSIATVERAYLRITYGYDEPDTLRCHPEVAKWFCALSFYNCEVKSDSAMPPNLIRLENNKYPEDPLRNCEVAFE